MAIDPKVLEYATRMGSRAGRSPYTANTAAPVDPPPKYPYIDKALERLSKQRAARMAGASPAGAQPTFVNDTTIPKPAQPSKFGNFIRSAPNQNMGFLRRNVNRFANSKIGKAGYVLPVLAGTAFDVANTPTKQYRERFGFDPNESNLAGDIGARALGAASDLGNNMSLGFLKRFFRDQQNGQESGLPLISSTNAETGGFDQPGGQQPRQPARPQQTGRYSSQDVDNPGFVPKPGTGVFRNERTGRTQTIEGQERQPVTVDQSGQVVDEREPVQIPNLALATDVDSLPAFLSQLTGAQQSLANNAARQGSERGFLKRVKEGQGIEKAEIGLEQSRQLKSVFDALNALNDENDPGGAERKRLTNLALTLQGKSSGSTKGLQLLNPVFGEPDEFGIQQRQLVQFDPATGQMTMADPGQQQQEGYTDEDLEFTAKQHGISVEEVKKQLGIK